MSWGAWHRLVIGSGVQHIIKSQEQSTHFPPTELWRNLSAQRSWPGLRIIIELCSHDTARWCSGKVSLNWGDWQLPVFTVSYTEWPFCAFAGGGSGWLLRTPVSFLRLRHTHAICGRKSKCFPYQQMLACLIILLACVASDRSQGCTWSTLTSLR